MVNTLWVDAVEELEKLCPGWTVGSPSTAEGNSRENEGLAGHRLGEEEGVNAGNRPSARLLGRVPMFILWKHS